MKTRYRIEYLSIRSVILPDANNQPVVSQANDYFPFGMSFESTLPNPGIRANYNKLKYNSKEEQEIPGKWLDYGARFYDAQLGRWHGVDPLANDEMQIDKSPYNYAWNNPINIIDPDGNCPWCIGAIVGAATDYALQVATNYVEGKTGAEAWTDVSGSSIAVSAGAGAAGVGIATKVGKAMKVAKMAKGMKTAITVGSEVATDAAASATNQLVTTGEVDLKDVAIDATAGQIVGKTVSKAVQNKAQASKTAKVLHNQADRAQRVAKGSREVRQVAADKATQKAESYGAGRATAAGAASSGTASTVVKELDDKNNQ